MTVQLAEDRLYQLHPELCVCESTISRVEPLGDGDPHKGTYNATHRVRFVRNIFHPQGGGQPSDTGSVSLVSAGGSKRQVFEVVFTRTSPEDGAVDVIGRIAPGSESHLVEGAHVELQVDAEKRRLYSRLHSAGHLLDSAMILAGYTPDKIRGTKGYHFTDNPYVEFEVLGGVALSDKDVEDLLGKLNVAMESLRTENPATENSICDRKTAAEKCGVDTTHYPETVRVIKIGGHASPCGGTHMMDVSSIGTVKATKIRRKKQNIKVFYELLD